MPRVLISEGCREVDSPATGTRYFARGGAKGYRQGGSFDMCEADAKAAVRIGGAIASEAGTTSRALGYRCGSCGFGAFTRRCGRCGKDCHRER
jgi:hypothetical protein